MNKILHRLLMAALGTAAIFTINALNTLTEASPAAEFEGTGIHQDRVFPADAITGKIVTGKFPAPGFSRTQNGL
ncbi:MAG: hypothetical protein MUE44_17720 [Oscillatoriaceae cyanobacterium Prado104]|nr:hypothetical protein [Oscillatoriaceae cyanobacterium Prado104]